MEEKRHFQYRFTFPDGTEYTHEVDISEANGELSTESPPEWTKLEFNQCDGCTWTKSEYCPVALRLVAPLEALGSFSSFDRVHAEVVAEERSYHADVDIQKALSSLFGLIMATSGCPSMEPFRAMAWFHLPFSSVEETVFRVMSSVLMTAYLSGDAQIDKDTVRDDIHNVYQDIMQVNQAMLKRMREGTTLRKDAAMNAVIILDALANLVPFSVEDGMADLEQIFSGVRPSH